MKTALYILSIALVSLYSAKAQTFEVNGIYYNVINSNEVEVTTNPNDYNGDIVIPATVNYQSNSYTVTTIGDYAFEYENILSIALPNTLTHIGEYAFRFCNDMTSVTLPDSVTSIGKAAFLYCTMLQSINIPDGVAAIEQFTFGFCDFTSISIPQSITSLGTYSFTGCDALATVNVDIFSPIFIYSAVFSNLDLSQMTLNVPVGSETDYSNASVWQNFGNINGVLSTDEFLETLNLKLYPNPASTEVYISGLKQAESYQIYNAQGKQIQSGVVDNLSPMNIEILNDGVYFVRLKNGFTEKIIKR